jgi:predicted secreted hydrolase
MGRASDPVPREGGRVSGPAVAALLLALFLAGLVVALVLGPRGDRGDPDRPGRASESLAAALGAADTAGFARVTAPRPFHFPEDHGPHPEYRTEWWYFTGNLDGEDGRRFGYQLTLFRNAIAPRPPEVESEWATNQVWMGHLGVTDVAARTFHGFERFARGAAGLGGAAADPLRVWLEDWSIVEVDDDTPGRMGRAGTGAGTRASGEAAGAPGAIFPVRLQASGNGVALDLTVRPGKPIVLQGDRGYSRKGPESGNASHYYSFPRLPTSGTITVDGRTLTVRGESWLDREWSTSALGEGQVGWDWFALHFEDETEIMYYQLRGEDGSADPFSRGTFVDEDGGPRALERESVSLEVLDSWTSPLGGTYPSRWRMRIPALGLDLEIEPVLADQEHDAFVRYWEGAVDIRGSREGRPLAGRGYVELTGYADAGR